MTTQLDIFRTAELVIRQHGDGAQQEAVRRADALSQSGNEDGAGIWRQIAEAIEELQHISRSEGEPLN